MSGSQTPTNRYFYKVISRFAFWAVATARILSFPMPVDFDALALPSRPPCYASSHGPADWVLSRFGHGTVLYPKVHVNGFKKKR